MRAKTNVVGKQISQQEPLEIDEIKETSAALPFYHYVEKQPNLNYVNQQNAEALTYTTLQHRDGRNQEYQQLIP